MYQESVIYRDGRPRRRVDLCEEHDTSNIMNVLQWLEVQAKEYPDVIALANPLLTFVLIVVTGAYVYLTRRMVCEMLESGKREVLPTLSFKVHNLSISEPKADGQYRDFSWEVTGNNTGRGAAFNLEIDSSIQYTNEKGKVEWYSPKGEKLPLTLKTEKGFERKYDIMLLKDWKLPENDADKPNFMVRFYWSDADGIKYSACYYYIVHSKQYSFDKKPYYSVLGVSPTPIWMIVIRFIFFREYMPYLPNYFSYHYRILPNTPCLDIPRN